MYAAAEAEAATAAAAAAAKEAAVPVPTVPGEVFAWATRAAARPRRFRVHRPCLACLCRPNEARCPAAATAPTARPRARRLRRVGLRGPRAAPPDAGPPPPPRSPVLGALLR